MTINIKINNQHITAEKTGRIIANSINLITAICTFDKEWDNYSKNIIFTNGSVSKMLLVTDGIEFTVPHEVLLPGKLEISAVGYSQNGEKRITTKKMLFPLMIYPSGELSGSASQSYTPELWEQISAFLGNPSDLSLHTSTLVDAINHLYTEYVTLALHSSNGLYNTILTQNHSPVYYLHSSPALEDSENILKLYDDTLSLSCDGGESFPYVLSTDSDVTRQLSDSLSRHISDNKNPHKITAAQIGAAPGGYGLGQVSTVADGDVSSITMNGFYHCSTGKDMPFDNASLLVINYDAETAVQIAHCLSDTDTQSIARRIITNGKAGEWEYFNPPMKTGVEYRTVRRWQGKAVYTKLVDVDSLPANSVIFVDVGIPHSKIISIEGVATNGTDTTLQLTSPSTGMWVNSDCQLAISTSSATLQGYTAKVTLKYIKD